MKFDDDDDDGDYEEDLVMPLINVAKSSIIELKMTFNGKSKIEAPGKHSKANEHE